MQGKSSTAVTPVLYLLPLHLLNLPSGLFQVSREVRAAVSVMLLREVTDNYTNRDSIVPHPGLCGDAMETPKRVFCTAFNFVCTPAHVYTRYEAPPEGAWKTTAAAAEKSKEKAKKASL